MNRYLNDSESKLAEIVNKYNIKVLKTPQQTQQRQSFYSQIRTGETSAARRPPVVEPGAEHREAPPR